jgi:hypothetical protein
VKFGASQVQDLADADDSDLAQMGFKKIEIGRLRRACLPVCAPPTGGFPGGEVTQAAPIAAVTVRQSQLTSTRAQWPDWNSACSHKYNSVNQLGNRDTKSTKATLFDVVAQHGNSIASTAVAGMDSMQGKYSCLVRTALRLNREILFCCSRDELRVPD